MERGGGRPGTLPPKYPSTARQLQRTPSCFPLPKTVNPRTANGIKVMEHTFTLRKRVYPFSDDSQLREYRTI